MEITGEELYDSRVSAESIWQLVGATAITIFSALLSYLIGKKTSKEKEISDLKKENGDMKQAIAYIYGQTGIPPYRGG